MAKIKGLETLKEKKQELVRIWEQCFEQEISEALTEKGLEKYWSDETSLEVANEMLDQAALNEVLVGLFSEIEDNLVGAIVINKGKAKEEEPCNVKNGTAYKVIGKPDNYCYPDEFETIEAANEFIKNEAANSILTVKDFMVVQVVK